MVLGGLDYASLWQGRQSAEAAARAGGRTASSTCLIVVNDPMSDCDLGNRATDDADILSAIRSAVGNDLGNIESVVIYNAVGTDTDGAGNPVPISDGSPIQACQDATAPNGVVNYCNVYGQADVSDAATLTGAARAARFGCSTAAVGVPGQAASFWCALRRTRNTNPPISIGVAIKSRHKSMIGIFGDRIVWNHAVFSLEPNTAAPDAPAPFVPPPPPPSTTSTTTTTTTTTSTTTTTTIAPPTTVAPSTTAASTTTDVPTTTTAPTTTVAPPTTVAGPPTTGATTTVAPPTTAAPTLPPTTLPPTTLPPSTTAAPTTTAPPTTTAAPTTTTTTTTTTRVPRPCC